MRSNTSLMILNIVYVDKKDLIMPTSLHMCALCSELPSDKSTMGL